MNVRGAIAGPLGLARAGLRGGRRDAVVVAAVVAVTAFLVSLGPLWFGRAADDVLRDRLATATEAQRGLEFELRGRLDPGAEDPLAAAAALGAGLAGELPPTLAGASSGPELIVDGQELLAIEAPRPILRLALRMQDVGDGIRWAAGRAPGPATRTIEVDRPTADGVPPKAIAYEVAISGETAATTGLEVGDRVLLVPGSNTPGFVAVDVVGVFDVVDPAAARWFTDATLARTVDERVSQEVTIHHAVALVHPGVYPALHGTGGAPGSVQLPFRYRWRFGLDAARLPVERSDAVAAELARLRAGHPFGGGGAPALSTGLAELVERYRADRAAAAGAVAVAAVGPLAAMLGMLALLVATSQRRRDEAFRAVRSRGGGSAVAVAGRALETGVVALPAALAAGALASLLVAGGVTAAALGPALAVGAVVTVLAAAAAVSAAQRPPVGREAGPGGRAGGRRLVLDLLVVAIALGAAATLRGDGGRSGRELDPVVAALPVLLALAGGILVLRAYPAAVRLVARASAGRPGLVAVHALRGVERGAAGHDVPLLALVLAVATGVFAALAVGTLDHATDRAAAERVGADFRVEQRSAGSLPGGLDLASIPGVEATATAGRADGRLAGTGRVSLPVDVVVLDVPAWIDVAGRLPLAGAVPAGLAGLPPVDAGSAASPVEALVGAATLERLGLAPGAVGQLTVGDRTATVRIAGTPEVIPGLGAADELVVLDRAAADAALPGVAPDPWAVFLRAPPAASGGLAAEVGRFAPEVTLVSREDALVELRAAPLAQAIRAGFGVALAVALLYAVAVVALASRRAIGARRRELAVLRVLGLPPRGLAGLLALELAPLVVAALVAGAGLGVVIAALVLPDLAVARLVGLGGAATLAGDPALLLLLAAAPVLGAAAAILVGARGIRRGDLADATRAVEP